MRCSVTVAVSEFEPVDSGPFGDGRTLAGARDKLDAALLIAECGEVEHLGVRLRIAGHVLSASGKGPKSMAPAVTLVATHASTWLRAFIM